MSNEKIKDAYAKFEKRPFTQEEKEFSSYFDSYKKASRRAFHGGYTAGQAEAKPKPCVWTDDGDGKFITACDEELSFDGGMQEAKNWKYCPYCGGELKVLDRKV